VELVHERTVGLRDEDGVVYDRARIYGEPQDDGRWGAFIEFVSVDDAIVVRSPRETTQRNLNDVAYWATGLEEVYFEGALDRALRSTVDPDLPSPVAEASPPVGMPRTARLEIESRDPTVALRVMGTRTLTPGQRRRLQQGAILRYDGTLRSPGVAEPGRFAFVVEFGSANAAAILANFLWSALHASGATVMVEGAPVALTNSAPKDTLLATAA
jgi:hypothetical protein